MRPSLGEEILERRVDAAFGFPGERAQPRGVAAQARHVDGAQLLRVFLAMHGESRQGDQAFEKLGDRMVDAAGEIEYGPRLRLLGEPNERRDRIIDVHEIAPRGTWWALTISFAGVLLVVRPGSAVFQWAALLPLVNAFCYAGYQLVTRRLAGVDDGVATLFIGTAVAAALTSVVLPFQWRPPQSALDAAMFFAIGAFGGVGHLLLVRAFEQASATLLAPFAYVHIVFALALGMAVFGNFPDAPALAGMALIVATGVWMAMRQRVPIEPVEE